jgi:hypothetical protein
MKPSLSILLFPVLVTLVGCGGGSDQPKFANVSGTVTYNGKPLEKGQITFQTDGRGPTASDIVDGKYTGQAMVGSNRVAIAAFRKAAKPRVLPEGAQKQIKAYQELNKSGGGGTAVEFDPSMEDYIPEEYGKNSKQVREVQPGASNNFDFNIKGN